MNDYFKKFFNGDASSFRESLKVRKYEAEKDKFNMKAYKYAKELEAQGKKVTYSDLRAKFLKLYQEKNELFKYREYSSLIMSAIETELGKRGVRVPDDIIEEFEKIVRQYKGDHNYDRNLVKAMIQQDIYPKGECDLGYLVDFRYISFAIQRVFDQERDTGNKEGSIEL